MNLPTKITLSRLILVPVFIIFYYFMTVPEKKYLLAGIFIIMALTDLFDGIIARRFNMVTRLGALLDPIADKIVSLTVIIFYIGNGIPAWMAFLLLSRDILILALRGFAVEYKIDIMVSWWGKTKTFVEMIAFFLIILELTIGTWILGVTVILSLFSGFDYFTKGFREFRKNKVIQRLH